MVMLKFGCLWSQLFVSFCSSLLLALCCFSRKFGAVGTQTTTAVFSRLGVYHSVSSVLEFPSDRLRSEKHVSHFNIYEMGVHVTLMGELAAWEHFRFELSARGFFGSHWWCESGPRPDLGFHILRRTVLLPPTEPVEAPAFLTVSFCTASIFSYLVLSHLQCTSSPWGPSFRMGLHSHLG